MSSLCCNVLCRVVLCCTVLCYAMLWSVAQYNCKLCCRRLPESGFAWVEGLNGWIANVGVGVGVRVWMREGQGSPNHQKKRTRRAAGSGSRTDNDWKRGGRDSAG
ncbi:hypothetical protein GGR58DRAFT_459985 [Xylaria digitata]|nr:hypothetical protein GGR58DRAFT_459985 [Xylaria digitata]